MSKKLANKLYNEGKHSQALPYYISCAKNNDRFCQRRLGFIFYRGKDVIRDLSRAEHWFLSALENGDIQSSVGLFRIYVEKGDYNKAIFHMRMMARKKYSPAIYWLGRMYFNGFGVKRDKRKALVYFSLGRRLGHFPSMRDRAKLLLRGECGICGKFRGIVELSALILLLMHALYKDLDDERQYY